MPTLKNVRLALQTLELLSFPVNRIRFVLNRANSNVGLSKREVEAALEVTISHEIPSERIVPVSVNRGIPAVLSEPGSDYAKSVLQLAKSVLASPAAAKAAKGATAQRRKLSLARS